MAARGRRRLRRLARLKSGTGRLRRIDPRVPRRYDAPRLNHARPRRHVGRGRLVGRSGAPRGGGSRRGRRHDARRGLLRRVARAVVLRAGRPRRRAPRRPAARDPVLRRERGGALRGAGDRAVRRGLPRRPHPEPLRRLQRPGEVRVAPLAGARARREARHRALRAGGAARRPARAVRGRRSGEGPELLPVRPRPGGAPTGRLPGGRHGEVGRPRGGTARRPRERREARLPGDSAS